MPKRDETSPARYLGEELRRARVTAGIGSQDAMAARLRLDRTAITRIESGERPPAADVLAAWCQACGLPGVPVEWTAAMARRGESSLPGWFRGWAAGEQTAVRLRWFELTLVPGLLQTENYARALLTGRIGNHAEQIEERVKARMERQAILTRDDPVELLAVIDQAVLSRGVGGPKVMAEQAEHLIGVGGLPNVVIQVIPSSTAVHDGLAGAGFIIADLEEGPSLCYQETALRGMPIIEPRDVATLGVAFDRIRAEALPRAGSLQLLEEKARSWSQAAG